MGTSGVGASGVGGEWGRVGRVPDFGSPVEVECACARGTDSAKDKPLRRGGSGHTATRVELGCLPQITHGAHIGPVDVLANDCLCIEPTHCQPKVASVPCAATGRPSMT